MVGCACFSAAGVEKTVELHSSHVEKTVEFPQCSSSLLDKVIDMPVDMRLQVPDMVQTVPKTWSSQVQFLDHVALPVVCKTEVQTVQKPVCSHRCSYWTGFTCLQRQVLGLS